MAVHGAQYIFGEFSPDEFNQFFVTPRCSVELPPYNDTISCGLKSTGELHDGKKPFLLHHCFPNPFEVQCIAGEEYQRIEFGVNEVIEAGSSVLNNSDYSISSTLNPQAPEFILGCAPTPKTPSDVLGETNHNSIDCQFNDASLALDNGSNAENDSFSGSLGQRERKKKKKRPPGYYSYLEDVSDGVPAEALINGHASSPRLNSISIDDVDFAELLENVKLIHKPVSLQPRGLINKGNWCYINATLQALVACPPMYHLMKSIPMFSKTQRPCTSTPMIDSFVRLMNEFTNMPVPPKAKQALSDKIARDIRPGAAFEPTYIYRLLTVIKSSLSEKVRIPHGRQEDAEEYLGFILNGLHEEMLILKKLLSPHSEISNGPETQLVNEEEEQEEQGEGSEDEWEQVGPRNKSSVTRQADFVQTPITDIFGGHIRSVVYQQSSKESATLQPFFTLQLDIQSDRIRTVQDALESLVARESVQGYTTKTKQEVEISRRVTLEELPPVLVLHLKRFVYEKTGGCQKLIKNIEYPVDLEISKELLSPGVKSKIFKGQRTYRLFAVVYHHGNSATGGHYTTDVFQIGLNGWLRIDDQAVKVITQHQVVKPSAERTAYLLYYRRVDLL
ncbi:ubiquitin carboxyl-terminal hydrolase 10 isoform X5 [Pituophis catenifer annectens]|uniref:ubiquitin carboxyl-terminal hydrolase 10 isoform X5 n=1 Tax=Pituophis catenifer annectens TaxID=94852 RepID=UPI00399419C0